MFFEIWLCVEIFVRRKHLSVKFLSDNLVRRVGKMSQKCRVVERVSTILYDEILCLRDMLAAKFWYGIVNCFMHSNTSNARALNKYHFSMKKISHNSSLWMWSELPLATTQIFYKVVRQSKKKSTKTIR